MAELTGDFMDVSAIHRLNWVSKPHVKTKSYCLNLAKMLLLLLHHSTINPHPIHRRQGVFQRFALLPYGALLPFSSFARVLNTQEHSSAACPESVRSAVRIQGARLDTKLAGGPYNQPVVTDHPTSTTHQITLCACLPPCHRP